MSQFVEFYDEKLYNIIFYTYRQGQKIIVAFFENIPSKNIHSKITYTVYRMYLQFSLYIFIEYHLNYYH